MKIEVRAEGRVAVVERSEIRIKLAPSPDPRDQPSERRDPVAVPLVHGSSSVIAPGLSKHIDLR